MGTRADDPARSSIRPIRRSELGVTASGTPGSGLGLFIARSMAALQGGRVEVESVPGAGATLRLLLPAAGPDLPG